jgi:pimeloyl-ACP methyl ester carboxylesterase
MNATKGDYASVNGLRMYYEVHGEGRPLVLLHGAYMTVDAMGPILPGLAESRRVIVPEMQAHGRTADIDRHITYQGMADDVAALLRHLGIEEADVFGYSMGGGVALQLAIRHPGLVRRLVVASASWGSVALPKGVGQPAVLEADLRVPLTASSQSIRSVSSTAIPRKPGSRRPLPNSPSARARRHERE